MSKTARARLSFSHGASEIMDGRRAGSFGGPTDSLVPRPRLTPQGDTMTRKLPPLNAVRAFKAAAIAQAYDMAR